MELLGIDLRCDDVKTLDAVVIADTDTSIQL